MEPTTSDVPVKKDLQCTLTQDELLKYSKDLAKQHQDKKHTEDAMKETAADFKARINRMDAEINELSRKVSNGYEYRDVECRWTYDWDEGIKSLYRQDTFDLVKQEPIEAHERQGALDLEASKQEAV